MSSITLAVGTTRFVLLVGPCAIKIARVRLLYPFARVIVWLLQRRFVAMYQTRAAEYGNPFLAVVQMCVLGGIRANLNERDLYMRRPDLPLMPTHCTLLGLVNIQMRGQPIAAQQMPRFFAGVPAGLMPELDLKPHNFCLRGDQLCLADYGGDKLRSYVLSEPTLALS